MLLAGQLNQALGFDNLGTDEPPTIPDEAPEPAASVLETTNMTIILTWSEQKDLDLAAS
jgi:hypothetical protein